MCVCVCEAEGEGLYCLDFETNGKKIKAFRKVV